MPLSKRYLDRNAKPLTFSVDALASTLRQRCEEVVFALLLGSAADGCVRPHSDLDLAFYVIPPASLEFRCRVSAICLELVGDVRCDIGILNNAEAVYRFEALKGRLLFTRDDEAWLHFFSVTSREYEHQMIHYARQRRYRLEGAAGHGAVPESDRA